MADIEATRREELEFVLASLDDLEAEYGAGDLDEIDYRALKSDYTTRAARFIRAGDGAAEPVPASERSWRRVALWTALIVVVAGLAGVFIADFSGSRGDGTTTGDIRETVRERKFEASQLLGSDPDRAREIYDEVLQDAPSDPEALAYRGWLSRLGGDSAAAQPFVENAVLSDPEYPDARVFAAAVALDLGDTEAAAGHLAALDDLDVAPFISQLVRSQLLRAQIVEARLLTGEPGAFADSGLTVQDVARAADDLLEAGELGRGLALYDVLLAEARDDPEVVTEAGWFLGRLALAGGEELRSSMLAADDLLSEALDREPTHAAALVYRAFVKLWLDDVAAGRVDLAAGTDSLDAGREDLDFLIAETDLRGQLG